MVNLPFGFLQKPARPAYVFAVIVVLVILIMAAIRRWTSRGARAGFASSPKTENNRLARTNVFSENWSYPNVQDATVHLQNNLRCISQVSDFVNRRGEKIAEAAAPGSKLNEARLYIEGARASIGDIVDSVGRLRAAVDGKPPTYQNAVSLYRGLHNSDQSLWGAAEELARASERMRVLATAAASEKTGSPLSNDPARELTAAAAQLQQMSVCFYDLVRSVHTLGAALELE